MNFLSADDTAGVIEGYGRISFLNVRTDRALRQQSPPIAGEESGDREMKGRVAVTLSALSPLIFCVFFATFANKWSYFFNESNELRYMDLRTITSNVSCSEEDPSWSIDGPSCDLWQRPVNYPEAWLQIFRMLGWGDSNVFIAGIAVTVSLVLALGMLMWSAAPNRGSVLLLVILSLSPPVFFALERGNTDAFIFLLLVAASFLQVSRRQSTRLVGVGVIALAAYLKVFPIGSLISTGLLSLRFRGKRYSGLFLGMVISALVLIALLPEARRIYSNTPSRPLMQFGVRALPAEFAQCTSEGMRDGYCTWSAPAEFGFGIGVAAILLYLLWTVSMSSTRFRASTGRTLAAVSDDRLSMILCANFGGAFLFTFLLGTNWYYRLILLIPIAMVFAKTETTLGRVIAWVIVACCFGMAASTTYVVVVAQFLTALLFSLGVWFALLITQAARAAGTAKPEIAAADQP